MKPPAANACPLVTATGAGSKIIHPPEDVSLEEIRARNIKYRAKPKPDAPAAQPQPAPAMITPSTSQAEVWVSGFLYLFLFMLFEAPVVFFKCTLCCSNTQFCFKIKYVHTKTTSKLILLFKRNLFNTKFEAFVF